MFFYFDPLYLIIMAVSLVLSLWATAKVKSAFHKYKKVASSSNLSGAEVAKRILDFSGVSATIEPTKQKAFKLGSGSELDDHYDPRSNTVRLSPHVYQSNSIAAHAIAAHEVGHAIQHAKGYKPLELRSLLAPVASIGSNLSYVLIFIGAFANFFSLIEVGIVLFGIAVLFQLVTLPVEFDASRKAKALLQETGLVSSEGARGVSAVLNAAALTYVAAAATALLNLAYLVLRFGRR